MPREAEAALDRIIRLETRVLFGEVVQAAGARGAVLTLADGDWLKVAKANLR